MCGYYIYIYIKYVCVEPYHRCTSSSLSSLIKSAHKWMVYCVVIVVHWFLVDAKLSLNYKHWLPCAPTGPNRANSWLWLLLQIRFRVVNIGLCKRASAAADASSQLVSQEYKHHDFPWTNAIVVRFDLFFNQNISWNFSMQWWWWRWSHEWGQQSRRGGSSSSIENGEECYALVGSIVYSL